MCYNKYNKKILIPKNYFYFYQFLNRYIPLLFRKLYKYFAVFFAEDNVEHSGWMCKILIKYNF